MRVYVHKRDEGKGRLVVLPARRAAMPAVQFSYVVKDQVLVPLEALIRRVAASEGPVTLGPL